MQNAINMTQGKPAPLIIRFGLPLMLSYIVQQLYNIVDSAVVGRLLGITAFAAVGAAGFLSWMAISTILGVTQGFGVLFAQCFGADNSRGLRVAIGNAVVLSAALAALITVLGVLSIQPVLLWINTPADIIADTSVYLYWIMAGMPITFAYNLVATLLRSLGNSKTPMYSTLISTVVNIALDIAFVAWLHMGVAGVAVATVIAQCVAFAVCLRQLCRMDSAHISASMCKPEMHTIRELMRLGGPLAFRNAVISVGGLAVQYVMNGFGSVFIAGFTAARKYFSFMEMAAAALDGASATYFAQNFGAGKVERIRSGMRCVRWMAVISSVVVALIVFGMRRWLISLLVTGEADELAQMIDVGCKSLAANCACLLPLYMLYIHRSALQGMGNSIVPMVSGFVELVMRIVAVSLMVRWIGEWGVYLSDGLGWIFACGLLMLAYSYEIRKVEARRALLLAHPQTP